MLGLLEAEDLHQSDLVLSGRNVHSPINDTTVVITLQAIYSASTVSK